MAQSPYTPEQQALISGYFSGRGSGGPKIKNPYKLQLPKVPGLRIRRGVTTGKFGKQDIIVDANGRVYGMMAPNPQNVIGLNPESAVSFLSVIKKKGKPGAPATPAAGGTPAKPSAAPDEYASYEKDYPWIASYLRSIGKEEKNFNDRYTNVIQPGVAAGLNSLGKIGEGIANTYGGMVGTSPQQPGYVSSAYGAASSLTPAQVASGMGGASSVFDPNAVAARQGLQGAQSAEAQSNARYRSLMAGLSPVSTAQGILGGLASQAASISKSYADKRMTERLKLDQWIAEQKSAAADRLVKQQYNAALLNIREDQLALDTKKANSAGQKTDAELSNEGFRRVPTTKMGAKSIAIVNQTKVTSKEGSAWYKPGSGGSGSGGSGSGGSGGPTANQKQQLGNDLRAAYNGTGAVDAQGQALGLTPGSTYRDMSSFGEQAQAIAAYVQRAIESKFIPPTQSAVIALLLQAIPTAQIKYVGGDRDGEYGVPLDKNGNPIYKNKKGQASDAAARQALFNMVIRNLSGLR